MLTMNKMPVVFVGHGSPMNAIEDNQFTRNWVRISKQIPKPEAILAISGHWVTDGTRINDDPHPDIVHTCTVSQENCMRLITGQKGHRISPFYKRSDFGKCAN